MITFADWKDSILAGIAISIGCIAYLATGYAWLFPIGLFIVCYYRLSLFTGKVCYVTRLGEAGKMAFVYLWNTLAAWFMGFMMQYVRPEYVEKAGQMVSKKMALGFKIIPLAILCNIMIFVAVDTYKSTDRFLGLIFATTIFVACGFEHCIANAFYFGLAGADMFTIPGGWTFLIGNAVFNAVGGIGAKRLMGYPYRL